VALLSFEIDDQTAEDLAIGLDHLRQTRGVLDVSQRPITGKQGRAAASVQIIAEPGFVETIAERCFTETTTLGLRISYAERRILPREEHRLDDGRRVKRVRRGDGYTAKTDVADVAGLAGHAARHARRRESEASVLGEQSDGG
jgi:uncharacterized protein (DUF111 family)